MSKKNYAYVNREMLIWARLETPFTTVESVELAAPSITATKLSEWENGKALPSVNEAKKLANLYKLPFATFFLSEKPPKKIKRYTDRRTLKGYYTKDISYKLWSEICRIESNRECIVDYTIENATIKRIPNIDSDNPTDIASAIRHYLGLETPLSTQAAFGNNPFNYYRNIIEHNGIIVGQVSGVDIEEMKGLSLYYEKYPIIAINNKDYERSKVFSLFHELAHIFRRSSSLCTIDSEEYSDAEETLCDQIAAEALMPSLVFTKIASEYLSRTGIANTNCIDRIAGRFGVSSIAALRRMYETKIISKKKYFDLWQVINDEYNANLAHIEEARKGKNIPIYFHIKYLNQNGYLLPRTILIAHSAGKITHGEMCAALGVKSKHIGNIEQAVMFK